MALNIKQLATVGGNGQAKQIEPPKQQPTAQTSAPETGGFTLKFKGTPVQQTNQTIQNSIQQNPISQSVLPGQTANPPSTENKLPAVPLTQRTAEDLSQKTAATKEITAAEYNHPSQPDNIELSAVTELEQKFEILKNTFTYPDQLPNSIANIVDHIRKHPFLKDNIKHEDLQFVVRGLRNSYHNTVTTKAEKVEKKQKANALISNMTADLDAMGFEVEV